MDLPSGSITDAGSPAPTGTKSRSTAQTGIPSQSTSDRKRRAAPQIHVATSALKRMKQMGRPKNGWTPTRKRKLVRLYLMTELDVDEIGEVLRAKGFQPW